jgi:hypothetical protein
MLVTLSGRMTSCKVSSKESIIVRVTVSDPSATISLVTLLPSKALWSMLVTESGMVTKARLVQREKALTPMVVTEAGMVRLVRLVHW